MTECDDCGTDVGQVWRRRQFETEGHRDLRWVCPTCHPELPGELTVELDTTDAEAATAERALGGATAEIRSDGGVRGGTRTTTARTDTTRAPAPASNRTHAASTAGRFSCPVCSGETIDGQGMADCLDCGWTGPR